MGEERGQQVAGGDAWRIQKCLQKTGACAEDCPKKQVYRQTENKDTTQRKSPDLGSPASTAR